jgi:hypothetical protein
MPARPLRVAIVGGGIPRDPAAPAPDRLNAAAISAQDHGPRR